jgi:ribosomal protein S18 acetylase RimI-like enzyme
MTIKELCEPADFMTVRELIQEYESRLGFDLGFQHFDQEMNNLPGGYARPTGCLLMAELGGLPAGCVGVRPFSGSICEMKRLYVRPQFRGMGLGRQLGTRAITEAKAMGYEAMRLDTIDSMTAARGLYASLGFKSIPAYRHNPIKGVEYLELELKPLP